MTLTVRLPLRVEQKLADYCAKRGLKKSDAVKDALERLLDADDARSLADHPFIGADEGDGSDVSGNVKAMLRKRFRKSTR